MRDPDWALKIEQEIRKKYGEKAVINPKKFITSEFDQQYRTFLKKMAIDDTKPEEKVNIDGVLLPSKLFIKEKNKKCCVCNSEFLSNKDELYLLKYETCERCYIIEIEGREDKWLIKKQSWKEKNLKNE